MHITLFIAAALLSVQSSSRALTIVRAGIDAAGGEEALRSIHTIRRTVTTEWFGSGQSKVPMETQPPSNEHQEGIEFADYRGNRWLEDVTGSDAYDTITRRSIGTPDKAFTTVTFHDELPFVETIDDIPAAREREFRRNPEHLLLAALDRPDSLRDLGGDAIAFSDALGTQITLVFDPQTKLLSKCEIVREHALGDTATELVYRDYRGLGNVKLPFRVMDRVAGIPTQDRRVTAIDINAAIADERFAAPSPFVAVDENPSEPRVEPLGKDLYLIRGPYNVVFAALLDRIVVFEAPLNSRYTAKCLELIHETRPDLPVTTVVSTHFHYDHIGGVRTYIARGIPIITTIDAKLVIERVARSVRTLRPDELSRAPVAPNVETIGEKRVLDDDVALYDVGPTDHVAHILVAYFPRDKVLYEADLFDPVSTQLVITGIDGSILQKKIIELGLDVERIIPVHGIPVTLHDLERGVAVHAKYQ